MKTVERQRVTKSKRQGTGTSKCVTETKYKRVCDRDKV